MTDSDRLAKLIADAEQIARDCADLARLDVIDFGEKRAWKAIENKLRAAVKEARDK